MLITKNNYSMDLFNGDLGIFYLDQTDGQLKVFFESADGFQKISPSRLPDHETVYAMTIHKSQGSEFDRVLLVLSDKQNEILTKELIYTGITRSCQELEIWGSRDVFVESVKKQSEEVQD